MASQTETLVTILRQKVDAANALATEAQKVLGNSAKTLRDARESDDTTDAKIVAYRAKLEKQEAAMAKERAEIDNYIRESQGLAGAWTDDETKAKREEHKTMRGEIKELRGVVEGMVKFTGETMPELPEVLNFSGTVATGGTTGVRRLRFDRVEVNGKTVDNLSAVTALIKRETGKAVVMSDVHAALFKEAKSDDVAKFPNDVAIVWTETDSEGVTHKYDVVVYKAKTEEPAKPE